MVPKKFIYRVMTTLKVTVHSNDHHRGNVSAAVTLLEYGDYQCPACRRAHLFIKRLLEERDNDVHFVFRHFPKRQFHPYAYPAAIAAEAAGEQGKFWEMHDLLFEMQRKLNNGLLVHLAQNIGLDIDQFTRDSSSEKVQKKVNMDFETGIYSEIKGTPTFFLNGSSISTYKGTYESLLNAVQLA